MKLERERKRGLFAGDGKGGCREEAVGVPIGSEKGGAEVNPGGGCGGDGIHLEMFCGGPGVVEGREAAVGYWRPAMEK